MPGIFLEKTNLARRRGPVKKKSVFLPLDKQLLSFTAIMIIAGLIFTYSSSAFDSMSYFKRQIVFDVFGVCAMLFLSQYYSALQKKFSSVWMLFAAWILLIWALLQPAAANVHRWINLGVFNIQPSEIAKMVLIIYLAAYLAKLPEKRRDNMLLITPLVYTLITLALIVAGKDLGIPALMTAIAFAMFFIAGAPVSKLIYVFIAAVPIVIIEIYRHPYRLKRIASFLNPEEAAGSIGYQLVHSFYAIGSGGWFGKGFGGSDLKLEYLPAAHTDFIFAIMCEEVGMIGVFMILAAFLWLLIHGIRLAVNAKDTFNSYLMAGITLCITLQAFVNMCVATGIAPTKGLPLPFFSYGGSSVVVTLAMMGILMNLAA
ncbi:FtsW/RodA/SpoVE family cell cycle protein, partial [Candidatus Proelusimicrobium excrementi]|uniref:FtsW/RodA/SpoVE family cell cycle protein n=1 Tax=Candidatus Proelusimicrobium excrementi TaxID=3416222 RepID=UPI003D09644C